MFPRRYFPGGGPQSDYTWPTPDAQGPLMRPLAKLATLVALSPVFRVRCGLAADDPVANEKLLEGRYGAQKRIFYPAADINQWNIFPAAVLFFGPDWSWETVAGGAQNYLRAAGTIQLILFDEDKYPKDMETSTRDFATFVGQFFGDLASQFALDDELAGETIRQHTIPTLCSVAEEASRGKAYWSASYYIDWSA